MFNFKKWYQNRKIAQLEKEVAALSERVERQSARIAELKTELQKWQNTKIFLNMANDNKLVAMEQMAAEINRLTKVIYNLKSEVA